MSNQPPKKLSQADQRKLRKVATGPLLGSVLGKPLAAPKRTTQAKPAPLGSYSRVRDLLEELDAKNPG